MMTIGNFLGFLEIRDRSKAITMKNSVRRTPWPNLLLVFAWVGIIWISSPTQPEAQIVDLDLLDDVNTTWTAGHSVPRRLVEIGDRVLFIASDGVNPRSLWASDGTPDGTQIVGFGISDEYRNWSPQFANLGDGWVPRTALLHCDDARTTKRINAVRGTDCPPRHSERHLSSGLTSRPTTISL